MNASTAVLSSLTTAMFEDSMHHEAAGEEHSGEAHGGGFAIFDTHELQEPFYQALLGLLLLTLAVSMVRMCLHNTHRLDFLPESGWLILFGCLLGTVSYLVDPNDSARNVLEFQSDTFFLILIPPIILEAGYHLRSTFFFGNFGVIVLYAVVGTILNTAVIGKS